MSKYQVNMNSLAVTESKTVVSKQTRTTEPTRWAALLNKLRWLDSAFLQVSSERWSVSLLKVSYRRAA